MAAILINGNGYDDVTAQVDADFYAGLVGDVTRILPVGERMSAEIINNAPRIHDGVICTKEGRRIQIDYGDHQDFTIPAGTTGTTAYYIIGFKLMTNSDDTQTCEPFVRAMLNASETIPEDMLKDGNAEVYVSVYRIEQTGTINAVLDRLIDVFIPLDSASIRNELFYAPGETATLEICGGGYVTAGYSAIVMPVPFAKSPALITGATITNSKLKAVQNGNYLLGGGGDNWASIGSGGITGNVELANNLLVLNVVKSGGYAGSSNNAACGVRGELTITFS